MKAKNEPIYSKDRRQLHELVPLDTPFTIVVEPSTYCNLKCNFCTHSLAKDEMKKNGHIFAKMEKETFDAFVSQLKEFPQKIKSVSFVGYGEPLSNKYLPYMIHSLKECEAVERTTVVTNGVLLSKELSASLVDAGLDALKISVNGLSPDDYLKNCGVAIDFNKYVSEIAWLYENKGSMQVYAKTLDTVLGGRDENEFFGIFGNYCDMISVEHTQRCHIGVDYDKLNIKTNITSIIDDLEVKKDVCSALFYVMALRATGNVGLCCNAWRPATADEIFNVAEHSLKDVWNCEQRQNLILRMLKKDFTGNMEYCKVCASKYTVGHKEDYLDPYADEIYNRILERKAK